MYSKLESPVAVFVKVTRPRAWIWFRSYPLAPLSTSDSITYPVSFGTLTSVIWLLMPATPSAADSHHSVNAPTPRTATAANHREPPSRERVEAFMSAPSYGIPAPRLRTLVNPSPFVGRVPPRGGSRAVPSCQSPVLSSAARARAPKGQPVKARGGTPGTTPHNVLRALKGHTKQGAWGHRSPRWGEVSWGGVTQGSAPLHPGLSPCAALRRGRARDACPGRCDARSCPEGATGDSPGWNPGN